MSIAHVLKTEELKMTPNKTTMTAEESQVAIIALLKISCNDESYISDDPNQFRKEVAQNALRELKGYQEKLMDEMIQKLIK